VPSTRLQDKWKDVTPEDIVACQDAGNSAVPHGLRPEDVIVHNLKIDWAMKSKNPVDSINFYQDFESTQKFQIPKAKVSLLIPDVFLERKVRVYSRHDDIRYIVAVEQAFMAYQLREFGAGLTVHRTPVKAGRKRPLDLPDPVRPGEVAEALAKVEGAPTADARSPANAALARAGPSGQ
jgi:hypothetical protein